MNHHYKKLWAVILVFVMAFTTVMPVYAQSFDPFNLELSLEAGNESALSAEQNYVNLSIKSTGAQTTFTNAKVTIDVDRIEYVEFDIPSITALVAGTFDTVEVAGNQLILSASEFKSGQYYELPLTFQTVNGIVPNGQPITFTASFTSTELTTVTEPVSVTNIASSPVKINKAYLGMSLDSPESQGLYYGSESYWQTKAVIDYKDMGQEFIKEGTHTNIKLNGR